MEGDKIGMELGTHNVGKPCGVYITKGCKANSYTLLYELALHPFVIIICFAYIVCA